MATTLPQLQPLAMPFANNGDKNTIPTSATSTGNASLAEGFPPITQTPIEEGGIPPSRKDFNGILNLATRLQYFLQQGGYFTFDTTVATLLGGYPENAVLYYLKSDGSVHLLKSAKTNNTDNFITTPSVIGTSWIDVTPGAGNVVYYSPDGDTGNSLLQNEDGTTIVVSGKSLPNDIDITGFINAPIARLDNLRILQKTIGTEFDIIFEDVNIKHTATVRASRQTNGNSVLELIVRNTDGVSVGSLALQNNGGNFRSFLSKCSGGASEIARCDWVTNQIQASEVWMKTGQVPCYPKFSAAVDLTSSYNSGWTSDVNGWLFVSQGSVNQALFINGHMVSRYYETNNKPEYFGPIRPGDLVQSATIGSNNAPGTVASTVSVMIYYPNITEVES